MPAYNLIGITEYSLEEGMLFKRRT